MSFSNTWVKGVCGRAFSSDTGSEGTWSILKRTWIKECWWQSCIDVHGSGMRQIIDNTHALILVVEIKEKLAELQAVAHIKSEVLWSFDSIQIYADEGKEFAVATPFSHATIKLIHVVVSAFIEWIMTYFSVFIHTMERLFVYSRIIKKDFSRQAVWSCELSFGVGASAARDRYRLNKCGWERTVSHNMVSKWKSRFWCSLTLFEWACVCFQISF